MKTSTTIRGSYPLLLSAAAVFIASACATTTPVELKSARVAYGRASAGPAAQLEPADLHKAKTALDLAEQSLVDNGDSQKTVDLAYIAERTAQIAEAHAASAESEAGIAKAKQDYAETQGAIAKKTLGDLAVTREQLHSAERGKAQEAQQIGVERSAREAAEMKATASDQRAAASDQRAAASDQNAKEANDALAKLAAKDEERGMVITLSGSVLFRTNDATLLPAALERLNQVADALVTKGHSVVIEGYTDSIGTQANNMNLSQRRAESVRSYLVARGFPAEKISAQGMGPDRPVAENTTPEGRANNRRVEIVIAKNSPRMN